MSAKNPTTNILEKEGFQMKKFTTFTLAITLVIAMTPALSACDNGNIGTEATPESVETTQEQPQQEQVQQEEVQQEEAQQEINREAFWWEEGMLLDGYFYPFGPYGIAIPQDPDDAVRYSNAWFYIEHGSDAGRYISRWRNPGSMFRFLGGQNHTIEDFQMLFGLDGLEVTERVHQLDGSIEEHVIVHRAETIIDGNEVSIVVYNAHSEESQVIAIIGFNIIEGTNLHDENTSVTIHMQDFQFLGIGEDFQLIEGTIGRYETELREIVSHVEDTGILDMEVVEKLAEIVGFAPSPFRWRADVGFYGFGWADWEHVMLVELNNHPERAESDISFLVRMFRDWGFEPIRLEP